MNHPNNLDESSKTIFRKRTAAPPLERAPKKAKTRGSNEAATASKAGSSDTTQVVSPAKKSTRKPPRKNPPRRSPRKAASKSKKAPAPVLRRTDSSTARQRKTNQRKKVQLLFPIGKPILLFRKEYESLLFSFQKCQTRRVTKSSKPWFNQHYSSYKRRELVRVWCGGYGRLIGYVLYSSVSWQIAKDITEIDVACEGYPGHTARWFLDNHMAGVSDDDVVAVFSFIFIPL